MMKKLFLSLSLFFIAAVSFAQQSEWNSARILLEIEKLSNTGSVLYIAAHPDDENTRLIAYMANELKVRTGYLSLTRGDGGQNLIGEEQGAYLGLIRTQELLAARKTDGGEQFFTRAVDFGYSKSADETFTKWPHDSLLADVVWVIRTFKPDVIITRFPTDERAGHGQHTVSAILAEEAFDAAADPNRFPEQLKYVSVWKTKRLYWNNSTWWDKDLPAKIAAGDKNLVTFDVGGYNALLGKSYGEIAADSRTNHKSQGFGSTPTRGQQMEYLELKKGEQASNTDGFLSGIPMNWGKYQNGDLLDNEIAQVINSYSALHPEQSVKELLKIYNELDKMPEDNLILFKKQQVQNIIAACLGLWLEPVAVQERIGSGDSLTVINTCLKRAAEPLTLESIEYNCKIIKVGEILPDGINQTDTLIIKIRDGINSSPYWLNGRYEGLFNVADHTMIGKAQNDPSAKFIYHLNIDGTELTYTRGVVYKETDAVKGELYKPLVVLPVVTAEADKHLLMFNAGGTQTIQLKLTSHSGYFHGIITAYQGALNLKPVEFTLDSTNATTTVQFVINAPSENNMIDAQFMLTQIYSGDKYLMLGNLKEIRTINYDHIQPQTIFDDAVVRVVKVNTEIPTKNICYIEGAGDKVDESLRQLGMKVTTIDPKMITADLLSKYDVVIIGVRAYNVSKELAAAQSVLMNYVQNGGLVITQYSTNWDTYADQIGPYPFKISRGRVTDENSPVEFVLPQNPLLNSPNPLSADDFKGWVQERGIYFATDLAPQYQAPLTFTDPKEQPQNGSLIVADYGKGAFIYTGIVFFRELPAGVPGAFRLFVNMIEYHHAN